MTSMVPINPATGMPYVRAGMPTAPGLTFSPAGTPAPSGAASTDPFGMFDDPSTHFLTSIIKGQLGALSQPASDPLGESLKAFLAKQLGTLSSAPPVSFSAGNGLLNDFVTEGRQRISELNQAPFSAGEEAALKTRAREDQVIARDAAKQRVLQDAARRGLGESSGVIQEGMQSAEHAFTAADAKAQNDLMLYISDQIQQRKNKAADISQSLAGAGQADAAMQMQGQIASSSANQAHTSQIMGIAGALAEMAAQSRGEARARQGDVLSLATMLAELPVQRLQLAASLLNGTGGNSIPSLFNDVSTLNTAQTNATNTANANQSDFLKGLSSLAAYFANRKTGK